MTANSRHSGLVVERHRRHVTVESAGRRWLCQSGKRSLQPLIGDEVEWTEAADGTGVIRSVLDRRSVLSRIDSRGRRELVAANLSQLFVVIAPVPAPDWLVVDHYLVAAELAGLTGALVLNKSDLRESAPQHAGCYARAGYRRFSTSAPSRTGINELAAAMRCERSVLVGQSGVGKSSLLNALLGDAVQNVGALTGKGTQGRHTTSSAVLYRLAGGGEIIDAPGVRAYAPYIEDAAKLQQGFPEFRDYLGRCRFDNCRHLAEPGCAVKAAVADAAICRLRFDSYRRLYELIETLKAKRESWS